MSIKIQSRIGYWGRTINAQTLTFPTAEKNSSRSRGRILAASCMQNTVRASLSSGVRLSMGCLLVKDKNKQWITIISKEFSWGKRNCGEGGVGMRRPGRGRERERVWARAHISGQRVSERTAESPTSVCFCFVLTFMFIKRLLLATPDFLVLSPIWTLLHWCWNPGWGSRYAAMQPAQPTPLAELVKSLAGLHQTQHQALVDLKPEQEDRFRLLVQAQDEDRQILRSLLGREAGPVTAPSIAHVRLMKMGPQDDPEAFVDLFEKTAEACGWARTQWSVRLIPLLTGEAQVAAQQLPVASLLAYDDLKRAILQRVGRTPEQHRQRFRSVELGDNGRPWLKTIWWRAPGSASPLLTSLSLSNPSPSLSPLSRPIPAPRSRSNAPPRTPQWGSVLQGNRSGTRGGVAESAGATTPSAPSLALLLPLGWREGLGRSAGDAGTRVIFRTSVHWWRWECWSGSPTPRGLPPIKPGSTKYLWVLRGVHIRLWWIQDVTKPLFIKAWCNQGHWIWAARLRWGVCTGMWWTTRWCLLVFNFGGKRIEWRWRLIPTLGIRWVWVQIGQHLLNYWGFCVRMLLGRQGGGGELWLRLEMRFRDLHRLTQRKREQGRS